jgi:hypothetical protein
MVQQKTTLTNTKKYTVKFWARADATVGNVCDAVNVYLTDNETVVSASTAPKIFVNIPLTGGADWTEYTAEFDIPAFVAANPTADFTTSYFGVGIRTLRNTNATPSTKYSGVLMDDFDLAESAPAGISSLNYDLKLVSVTNSGVKMDVDGEVTINSIDGKTLKTGNVTKGQIIQLSKGIYIVRVNTNNKTYVQKIAM